MTARQAGAAAAVVGGLVLAALALHPAAETVRTYRTAPLTDHGGLLTLLVLGCAGGGAALVRRLRAQARGAYGPTPAAERLKDATVHLVSVVAAVLPIALVIAHFRDRGPSEATRMARRPGPAVQPTPLDVPVTPLPSPTSVARDHYEPEPIGLSIAWLCLAAAVIVLLVLAVRLWRRYGHLFRGRPGPAAGVPAVDSGPVTGRVLAEAVVSGRAALHGTDARAAVIACYAAMEESLGRSGIGRLDSDSPDDLLRRAAGEGLLRGPEAGTLAALFREARYSSHPMDAGHLDRASAALEAIAAHLRDRTERGGADGREEVAR
ncbi:DUF4129 domain-containing protein [Kitasatospora camelliae]|uniref:DUF4129 domain-containing protein n=1 Tax=Kitasatospora camelliae TaxID=3156397 RepID=A0AAU8K618_9ACTN